MDELEKSIDLTGLSITEALQLRYDRSEQTLRRDPTTVQMPSEPPPPTRLVQLVRWVQAWLGLQKEQDHAIANPTASLVSLKDILPDFDLYDVAHIRWAFYYLKLQEDDPSDSALATVQGYLEAFEHFCELQAWLQASELLLKPLENGQPLHEWLQTTGYAPEVIPLYEALLHRVNPGMDGICWRGLGQAYYRLQNFGAAAQAWQTYLDHRQREDDRPVLETVYLPLGFAQYQTGDLTAAIATWQHCLPHFPDAEIQGIPVNFYWGLAYYAQDEFAAAIAPLQAALSQLQTADLNPQRCQALEALGYAHIYQDQTTEAIAAWEELSQSQAEPTLDLLKNLGFAHSALQQHTSTIAYLTRYVQSEEPTPAAWTALGLAHYQQRQFEAAIATLERGLAQGQPPEAARSMRAHVYRMLGDAHYQRAHYPAAQPYLEQYCAQNVTSLKPQEQLTLWAQLGHCAYVAQRWTQVIQYGEAYRQNPQLNPQAPATIQFDAHLGQAYFSMGQYARAIVPLERYLRQETKPTPEPLESCLALQYLGQAYFEMGQYAQTIAPLEAYLQQVGEQPQDDLDAIAAVEFALGKAAYKMQDYARAHHYLSGYLNAQDPVQHLDIVFYCGSAAAQIADVDDAIARFEQYLELTRPQPANPLLPDEPLSEKQAVGGQSSPQKHRASLRHLGLLHAQGNRPAIALDYLRQYLVQAQETNDVNTPPWRQAVQTAGQLCQAVGDYPEAIAHFTDLSQIAQDENDRSLEHLAQLHLSEIQLILGRYGKAQERLTQILAQVDAQAEASTKAPIKAKAMAQLGAVYHAQGQAERGLFFCQKALRLTRALEDLKTEGQVFNTLGIIYRQMDDRDRAVSLHKQAQTMARSIGDPRAIAIALGNLGMTYGDQGDHALALVALRESLTLAEQEGDRYQMGQTLCYLGQTRQHLGKTDAAQTALEQSLRIAQTLKARPLEAEALYQIAQLKHSTQKRAAARQYSQNAIALADAYDLPTLERYEQFHEELIPSLWQRLRIWLGEWFQRLTQHQPITHNQPLQKP